jgi:hypothetical protein
VEDLIVVADDVPEGAVSHEAGFPAAGPPSSQSLAVPQISAVFDPLGSVRNCTAMTFFGRGLSPKHAGEDDHREKEDRGLQLLKRMRTIARPELQRAL